MFGPIPTIQLSLRQATIVLLLGAALLAPAPALAAVSDVPLIGDIDGDGKSDLIVWRPGTVGTFRWVTSSSGYSDGAAGSKQWGTVVGGVADVPLIGDIDGDGKADLIVWRPGTATFYWLTSSSGYSSGGQRQWGAVDQPDVPLVGDIDGDGKADLLVWRRGTGTFYWLTSSTAYSYAIGAQGSKQWGGTVNGVPDVPLLKDADGDGKADLFFWRPGTATFNWLTSASGYSTSAARSRQWGAVNQPDVPLVGDLDGDRKADLTVWRQGNGTFYWLTSSTGYSYAIGSQGSKQWGGIANGVPDVPLTGDIDGDGKADLIFARPATGEFHWVTSSSGYSSGSAGAYYPGASTTNQAPVVNAGSIQSITLPASANLNGTVTDDGLPVGSKLTRTWSKYSGPGTVTFGNVSAQSTTAGFSTAGNYILRLTASDGALSTYAAVNINVNTGSGSNQAPVVSAGSNQTVTFPASATLNGTATDDGLPARSTLTRTWSKVSGPGTVTFGNVNAQSTTTSFSAAGAYVLRLTASDSALSTSADVAVSVNATNQAPVVSTGSNQNITLPTPATLNGSATDDGLPAGSTLTRTWSKVSGPGTATFGNVNAQSTTAGFSAAGTYVLRLTASDSARSTSSDVTILVSDASSCSGVTVPSTTTNIQALVSAYPEGTTFCFQSGTYQLAGPVLARSRDRFIGQPGTVLDGQDTVAEGIWGYGGLNGQRDVVVQGMTLANFTGTAVVPGWYWTISQNDLHHNQVGVELNSYSTLDGNYIHDNRQYGLTGGPGADILIINNEVARNNTENSCGGSCVGDAGGSKIVGSSNGTTGLIWRNNNVHDNTGHGIWSDGNVRALYEGNIVSNNSGSGIFHEISWDAIIRNNTVTDNDSENIGGSCWWGANILINTSANVEVSGNTITASNGSNAICAVSADRGDNVAPYPTVVANFYVHDNIVYMNGSATSGLVKGAASGVINNRFLHNAYRATSLTRAWWTWPTMPTATWSGWQASAQDSDGTLTAW